MDKYWTSINQSREWHYIRKKWEGLLIKSKLIDRLKGEKSKLSFMDIGQLEAIKVFYINLDWFIFILLVCSKYTAFYAILVQE